MDAAGFHVGLYGDGVGHPLGFVDLTVASLSDLLHIGNLVLRNEKTHTDMMFLQILIQFPHLHRPILPGSLPLREFLRLLLVTRLCTTGRLQNVFLPSIHSLLLLRLLLLPPTLLLPINWRRHNINDLFRGSFPLLDPPTLLFPHGWGLDLWEVLLFVLVVVLVAGSMWGLLLLAGVEVAVVGDVL